MRDCQPLMRCRLDSLTLRPPSTMTMSSLAASVWLTLRTVLEAMMDPEMRRQYQGLRDGNA